MAHWRRHGDPVVQFKCIQAKLKEISREFETFCQRAVYPELKEWQALLERLRSRASTPSYSDMAWSYLEFAVMICDFIADEPATVSREAETASWYALGLGLFQTSTPDVAVDASFEKDRLSDEAHIYADVEKVCQGSCSANSCKRSSIDNRCCSCGKHLKHLSCASRVTFPTKHATMWESSLATASPDKQRPAAQRPVINARACRSSRMTTTRKLPRLARNAWLKSISLCRELWTDSACCCACECR